jgi:hypothetical protein
MEQMCDGVLTRQVLIRHLHFYTLVNDPRIVFPRNAMLMILSTRQTPNRPVVHRIQYRNPDQTIHEHSVTRCTHPHALSEPFKLIIDRRELVIRTTLQLMPV